MWIGKAGNHVKWVCCGVLIQGRFSSCKMAPLAPTKIWTKKEKAKKQNYLKVTPLAPTKIRTKEEKIKKQNVEPEPSSAEDDEDEGSHLHGFSTDDDDSSDEEDAMDDGPSAFDISKLPTIAKDDATVEHKLNKAKRQPVRLLLSLIKYFLLILSPDRRPWRSVHWTSASRVLRRSTQGLLFTIWQCHQATRLSQ
jgi:hypothetical protein